MYGAKIVDRMVQNPMTNYTFLAENDEAPRLSTCKAPTQHHVHTSKQSIARDNKASARHGTASSAVGIPLRACHDFKAHIGLTPV